MHVALNILLCIRRPNSCTPSIPMDAQAGPNSCNPSRSWATPNWMSTTNPTTTRIRIRCKFQPTPVKVAKPAMLGYRTHTRRSRHAQVISIDPFRPVHLLCDFSIIFFRNPAQKDICKRLSKSHCPIGTLKAPASLATKHEIGPLEWQHCPISSHTHERSQPNSKTDNLSGSPWARLRNHPSER